MIEPLFFSEQVIVKNEWGFKNSYQYQEIYEEFNGFIKFTVCGFLLINHRFIIVFPKGVLEKGGNIIAKEKAKLLLQVLFKYEKNAVKNRDIKFSDQILNDRENMFSTIAEIIRDYLLHGILMTNLKKQTINGTGKINWVKTFKKSIPIVQNDQLVYVDLVTEQKLKTFSAEITNLHWEILLEVEEHFGWLFNFKTHQTTKSYKPINIQKAKIILKKAMSMTFNLSEIKRYKLLYSYISKNFFAESLQSTNKQLLYAFKYEYVWEAMGKELFKHNEILAKAIPKYKWISIRNEEYREQIPDILMEYGNSCLFIIDAKYYRFNGKGDNQLPGGPDMGKQLLYLQSMQAIEKYTEIYNLFIVPASIDNQSIQFYAKGMFDHPILHQQFGEILTFQVDSLTMMQQYLRNTELLYSALLEAIEEYL